MSIYRYVIDVIPVYIDADLSIYVINEYVADAIVYKFIVQI